MRLAILGYGNMGRAIARAVRSRADVDCALMIWDKDEARRAEAATEATVVEPAEWFSGGRIPDVALTAVKPQDIDAALAVFDAVDPALRCRSLWLSIAAGVPIRALQKALGDQARICRAMPNTPAMIGRGMTGYAMSASCGDHDVALVRSILDSCGRSVQVAESMLNAITAVSGCGPAYVYLFIEALIEAGVTAGLTRDVARRAAVQTVLGAAGMVDQGQESPATLKSRVMSPGGATAAALKELEKHAFKFSVFEAVEAAARRAAELEP
jgi:pyrroline-5-carboxylate reductase